MKWLWTSLWKGGRWVVGKAGQMTGRQWGAALAGGATTVAYTNVANFTGLPHIPGLAHLEDEGKEGRTLWDYVFITIGALAGLLVLVIISNLSKK